MKKTGRIKTRITAASLAAITAASIAAPALTSTVSAAEVVTGGKAVVAPVDWEPSTPTSVNEIAGIAKLEKELTLDDIVIGDKLEYNSDGMLVPNGEAQGDSDLIILAENKKDDKKDDKKDENKGFDWGKTDKGVKYTVKALEFLDDDAGKVAQYGAAVYDIIKAGSKTDIGGLYKSGKNFLTLVGVLKKSNKHDVTLNELGQAISELKGAVEALSDNMKLVEQQSYRNGLQSFDNAVIALHTYCNVMQIMMQEAAYMAEEEGVLIPPADDASPEEQFAYNKALVKYMENSDSSFFKDFQFTIEAIKTNFVIVAGEVSKTKDQSPLTTYDNYVNNYFNFYSQGWYARQAYRSNVELELKRAYAQIAVYHNIGSDETYSKVLDQDVNHAYTDHISDALKALETNNAGDKNNKYSPTLGTKSSFASYSHFTESAKDVSKKQMQDYYKRLDGRTIREDLELAGYDVKGWDGDVWNNKKSGLSFNSRSKKHVGGLFGKIGGTTEYYHDILHWDGSIEMGRKDKDNEDYWRLSRK